MGQRSHNLVAKEIILENWLTCGLVGLYAGLVGEY